jgi:hypothetical protein
MKISYFTSRSSKIDFANEQYSLHPMLLLVDRLFLSSGTSAIMMMYLDVDLVPVDLFIKFAHNYFTSDSEIQDTISRLQESYPDFKKTINVKHKSKQEIIFEGRFKTMISRLRKEAKSSLEYHLKQRELFELIPFEKEKVLQIAFTGDGSNRNEEDNHIQAIRNILTGSEELLLLDPSVQDIFSSTAFDSNDMAACDFIKIPLWDFPLFVDITFDQMKYTRNELQPALIPFKSNLKELFGLINAMEFSTANLARIKQLCIEKISQHIAPVQSVIDQSLYLSERRNKYNKEYNIRFCLGIASAETLIDYFEKTSTLLPYVAGELKQQTGRHINLKASYLFATHEINLLESDKISILRTDKIEP